MDKPSDSSLDRLTSNIVASYGSCEYMHRIGEMFVPSRSKIMAVLELARQLIFPGFFGRKGLSRQDIRTHAGSILKRLRADLADQIRHCFCMQERCEACADKDPCDAKAEELTDRFLAGLPAVREDLALDAQAAYEGDPAAKSIAEVIYCYPGYYAITVYRIAHELLEIGVPLMPRIMCEHAHSVTGTDIHPGAEIGRSFFIDHATGVVIGETTKIGDNVKIYQGVTLGALSFPKDERGNAIKGLKRHPTIEDNVTIYANATILGGDTVIGKGVTVAGNTFVTHSISGEGVVVAETPKLQVTNRRRQETRPKEGKGHG